MSESPHLHFKKAPSTTTTRLPQNTTVLLTRNAYVVADVIESTARRQ